MNRSKTIALILGPCLVMAALLGYWLKTRLPAADAPLELHANVGPERQSAVPPSAHLFEDQNAGIGPGKAPAPAASVDPSSPMLPPPQFDVVRVEPTGEAVIAGHTVPNAQVAVIANGKIIAEGKSDASGQFAFVPPPLAPGEYGLSLRLTPLSGPSVASDQTVAVSVPVKGKGDVMVALAEPGKATVLLADPTAKAQTPKAEMPASAKQAEETKPVTPGKPQVTIKTAEIVEPGGFFATGNAAPGARLRLYLNASPLAEVRAGPDGRWSVKVGKGLVPGHYAVRADEVEASGSVAARAEVPFDYAPSHAQESDKQAPRLAARDDAKDHDTGATRSDAGAANSTAAAIVPEIQTATVESGANLWRISRATLGQGMRYTEIYAANSSQIRDPKLIYPGQIFVIPGQTN
jgi:nucleoid-associated protein YgaU